MAQYFGIRPATANSLLNGATHEYFQPREDVLWFTSEEAAIKFSEDFFRQRESMRDILPELFENELTPLPGVIFMWMEDKLPEVMNTINQSHGFLGTGRPEGQAIFVYCPPPGFDSNKDVYGHRPYLYSASGRTDFLQKMAQAYTEEGKVPLPEGYKPTLVPSDRVFVHYGSTEFDPDVFEPAYTRSFDVKPESGFWASPIDSSNNWDSWCKREEFCKNHPNIRCEFTLTPGAKVLHVQTLDDINFMLQKFPAQVQSGILPYGNYMEAGLPYRMIDYEAMAKEFDGICYDHSSLGNILGPWDCDSICVFNPQCMQFREIELLPVDPNINYDEFSDIRPDEDWLDEEEV